MQWIGVIHIKRRSATPVVLFPLYLSMIKGGWAFILRLVSSSAWYAGCPQATCVGWKGTLESGPISDAECQLVQSHEWDEIELVGGVREKARLWNPNALWRVLPVLRGSLATQQVPRPNEDFFLVPLQKQQVEADTRQQPIIMKNVNGRVIIVPYDNYNSSGTKWSIMPNGTVYLSNGERGLASTSLLSIDDSGKCGISNEESNIIYHVVLQRVFVPTHCTDNPEESGVPCLGKICHPDVVETSTSVFCCTGMCGRSINLAHFGGQVACACPNVELPMITNTVNCTTCYQDEYRNNDACRSCHVKHNATQTEQCPNVGCDLASMNRVMPSDYPLVESMDEDTTIYHSILGIPPQSQRRTPPSQYGTVYFAPPILFPKDEDGRGVHVFSNNTTFGYEHLQPIGACQCPFGSRPNSRTGYCQRCTPGVCLNGGLCNVRTGECNCTRGFFGPVCEFAVADAPPVPSDTKATMSIQTNSNDGKMTTLLITGGLAIALIVSFYWMKKVTNK